MGFHFTSEERQGGSPLEEHVFTMDVPGMGGRNSMDLCRAVHEGLLTTGGCLREEETLRYSRPPPAGPTWEGAYADDNVVIQKLSHAQLREAARLRDVEIVEDSVASYLSNGA